MKRLFLSILFAGMAFTASADEPSERLLQSVSSSLKSLGAYSANLEIMYGETPIIGSYEVDGKNYYINMAGQEVYGTDGVKYEVYNDRKEIIIDNQSEQKSNILDNPTNAFDFVNSGFDSSLAREDKSSATIVLTPKSSADIPIDEISLKVKHPEMLPSKILYSVDGENITIEIKSVKKLTTSIKSFEKDTYNDYEIIDFR